MIINTNISSLTAQEASKNTSNSLSSSLEKLSSGLKINKASDDASGLAIADKLRTQVTSIDQGVANGNSAVSLLQIADKSMAEQSTILDTIKAKLIQANTDTITTGTINANTTGLGLGALSTAANATLTKTIAAAQQTVVNAAISTLNSYRADIGSTQNQVESAVRNLMTQSTNLSAAESVIRDVDYAEESANFNKQNIISQAGSYAISQANTVQQNVLKLLQ